MYDVSTSTLLGRLWVDHFRRVGYRGRLSNELFFQEIQPTVPCRCAWFLRRSHDLCGYD